VMARACNSCLFYGFKFYALWRGVKRMAPKTAALTVSHRIAGSSAFWLPAVGGHTSWL